MSSALADVLPVLRTPEHARADGETYHAEVPATRVAATPWVAFCSAGRLLSRVEVANSGVSSAALYERAVANLQSQSHSWAVEQASGGLLGLFKKPAVLSCTGAYAAECILDADFLKKATDKLAPKSFGGGVAFFVPGRGQLRAVALETRDGEPSPYLGAELEAAQQQWAAAGADAVCPAQLGSAFVVGNVFSVGDLFAGEERPYVPPIENVRAMLLREGDLEHVTNGQTAPRRAFVEDLHLFIGVRDDNGSETPLDADALSALGLSLEASLDNMVGQIGELPVIDMGSVSGQPVVGFRGKGAIDQLASSSSLARLHARLGDPFVVHVYSQVRVAATTSAAPRTAEMLYELIELCDPRQPNVILTRGTPDYRLYIVQGANVSGVHTIG